MSSTVTDQPGVSSELSRDLTLFHIVMMGLGMMIGAGHREGTSHTRPGSYAC